MRQSRLRDALAVSVLLAALTACNHTADAPQTEPSSTVKSSSAQPTAASPSLRPAPNPLKNAYFGDLHLHTRNSFDAYIFNTRASPDDAYRYAKGGVIHNPAGFDLKLASGPLDFLAVTDHSEYLGAMTVVDTPGSPLAYLAPDLVTHEASKIGAAFRNYIDLSRSGGLADVAKKAPIKEAWAEEINAAKRAYEPGKFTTFVAYEFTSAPDGHNLHRNVIFKGDVVPEVPFSARESNNPEDLWRWLEQQRAKGMDAIAIPHNSNGSDGWMFERTKRSGEPIDRAYAMMRARNEPLAEITQTKGTSETHPMLSPNDEYANFEIRDLYVGTNTVVTKFDGGYIRKALRDGIQLKALLGVNPFKLGLVAASDSHSGAASYEEDNYNGNHSLNDGTPQQRASVPRKGQTWQTDTAQGAAGKNSASGLTGVWAEENTREAIFAAFERKETFATTGPRIRVRLFAGYDLDGVSLAAGDGVKRAYANGVPMGRDLVGRAGKTPVFLVAAMRDVRSAPLQRIQIVKGWLDAAGQTHEQVYDAACADKGRVDPKTRRCPENGASVNLETCAYSKDKGAGELFSNWRDPDFDPKLNAFYYARVLENPTCRWSTWDAIRNGAAPNPTLAKTIQERAYTSPIWFVPVGG